MIPQRIFPTYEPRNADFEAVVRQSIVMQPVMKMMSATMETVAPGAVTIRMPFDDRLTQQNGYLHAGVITTLLDSACGYAAFTLLPAGSNILSVEFKVNLLSPAKGNAFVAAGRVLKAGKTLTICEGELTAFECQGEEKVVAIMTATMMVMQPKE